MTNDLIRVQPARHLRVAFARWAVRQRPKVGTVSESAFGVPPRLFTDMPEGLLRGALVDGHPYVPVDDEPTEPAPAGAPELLGVATLDGLREAVPGQPLPEVPASSYGPDSVPLPLGDPDADAAAMVAATPPEVIERAMTAALLATDLAASNAAAGPDFAPLEDAPEEGELTGVLVGEDGPETVVPPGDTEGDAAPGGEDTGTGTPPVISEDTPADTGDTEGDTEGDSDSSDSGREAGPWECGLCDGRPFTSSRGLEVHRRRAHPEA